MVYSFLNNFLNEMKNKYRQRGFEIHKCLRIGYSFHKLTYCLLHTNRSLESNTLRYSWNTQFIDICGIQMLGTYVQITFSFYCLKKLTGLRHSNLNKIYILLNDLLSRFLSFGRVKIKA